ncbi:hypothetical protein SAMN05216554_3998 [Herbiconiux ginsengi]|uniref:Uncharacterized protein n=2 Tax=Herbiconiux ginsengi TaxID=381665 RepID=A0A1H3T527_9MICO|nr:hypothetical protein SAMN05216554_3998 [Herbiconiux ginsengi]
MMRIVLITDRPFAAREPVTAMSSSFDFNESAFRSLIENEAQAAINELAARQTGELDELRQHFTGHPIEEIKPALQELFAKDGGSITEPELSDWAQLISDGTRIQMSPQAIDWSE